jgi:hypothetical protein
MSNRKDFVSINTGGHAAHHSRGEKAEIKPAMPPMKTTGEVPSEEGRAKASPKFEEIKPLAKASKQEEETAIEDNVELVVEKETKVKVKKKKNTVDENAD